MLGRILKDPLLHFVLVGAILFWVYGYVSRGQNAGDRRIIIDDGVVVSLLQTFQSTWQRPPTTEEMRGLIETHIRDQILYREGVLMGLDRDDPVIRRRVIQKLSVVTEEQSSATVPTDAELEAYRAKNVARYSKPATYDLEQVMFDPVRHGNNTDAVIAKALKSLNSGADPTTVGDSTLLPADSTGAAADRLATDFGEEFAAGLADLPVGSWQGPVRSGFGLHLVRIKERTPGTPLSLQEARTAVTRDFENEKRVKASEDFYQKARQNYAITIEAGLPAEAKPKVN